MYSEDELLSLSGLQHISFCERQWALIHLEQQWQENYDTMRGALFHERAHTEGYSSAAGIRAKRGMRVWSYRLGLFGVADIVEFSADSAGETDAVVPVEYKVGRPKVEPWDRIQVGAQALCLEEMLGTAIPNGALFYGETRHREPVRIDRSLRDEVTRLSLRMHELYERRITPSARKTRHCRRCSLKDICLPELFGREAGAYWRDAGEELKPLS